jgi:MacB-like periplasmic core domain
MSALGIAIGVAAIVAVLGLSRSSQNGLLTEISQLGTNLLTVQNGQSLGGGTADLPQAARAMISRLPGVTQVQDTGITRRRPSASLRRGSRLAGCRFSGQSPCYVEEVADGWNVLVGR